MPTKLFVSKTPYEILFGKRPSYTHIKTVGCLCYAHNHGRERDKFDTRAVRCMSLGYPQGQKGWKLYDFDTKKVFVSRDVHFYKTIFPFAQSGPQHQYLDHQPIEGNQMEPLSDDPFHDVGPVISVGANPVESASSSLLVTEDGSSVHMPTVNLGPANSVPASTGPNAVDTTLDPSPTHDVRAYDLISGPTAADGPNNEPTDELVIQGEPTTARPQRHRRPHARLHDLSLIHI